MVVVVVDSSRIVGIPQKTAAFLKRKNSEKEFMLIEKLKLGKPSYWERNVYDKSLEPTMLLFSVLKIKKKTRSFY